MFRGLNPSTTEETLMEYVKPFGPVVSVKLILDRATGRSRGIAFAEFQNLADSKAFYEHYRQGDSMNSHKITIDGANVDLKYSRPQTGHTAAPLSDWTCPHCNINNFAKRSECFQCAAPRPNVSGGSDQPAVATLSILNLNLNTSKQTLINLFQKYSPVKSCRLLWDKSRNISRGTAFIEFYSVEEANKVLSQTQSLTIDGSQVRVSFARHNNSDTMPSSSSYDQHSGGGPSQSGGYNQGPRSSYGGPSSHNDNLSYGGGATGGSSHHHQQQQQQQPVNPYYGSSSSSSAGGHSSSQQQPPMSVAADPSHQMMNSAAPVIPDPLIGVPDAQDYDFDESSGFFFNPKINYYFDPKTQFFYDLNEKQFYYYDRSKQQFVKHEVTEPSAENTNPNANVDPQAQNPLSDSTQPSAEVNQQAVPPQGGVSEHSVTGGAPGEAGLPGPDGGMIDSLRAIFEQSVGAICSLCKRKFPDNQALLKHNQLSTLHKTNLEKAIADHLGQRDPQFGSSQPAPTSATLTTGSVTPPNSTTDPSSLKQESGNETNNSSNITNDDQQPQQETVQDFVHVSTGKTTRDPELTNNDDNAAKRPKLE